MPFENSTYGPVTFTLNGLADRDNAYAGLSVCAEIYLDVHHFLLGHKSPSSSGGGGGADGEDAGTSTPTPSQPHPLKPHVEPLTDLGHVKKLYSHPQAFGQTTAFLSTYLRGVEMVDVSSTSKAAELVAADATGGSAAIASELAGEVAGLDVLARCIEDRDDNSTRFFVIRKGTAEGSGPGGQDGVPEFERERRRKRRRSGAGGEATAASGAAAVEGQAGEDAGAPADPVTSRTKSLVSFTVPHHAPGTLAAVLECFRRDGLNLTSINSLPSLIRPFQYLFFVEFEGSRVEDPEGRVEGVLAEVAKAAQTWRWLGSWERQR